MKTLSLNLLALSLHLTQASCSPLSRRNSPPGSIQLPMPRGEPCCQGCTCNCCCKGRGTSKPPSETSETSRGRRQGSREGSTPREPSTKSTASRPHHDSGGREVTPTRDPRHGTRRPDEMRAAPASDQQAAGPVQAQGHGNLPLRGRRAASDQQGSASEAQRQAPRSKSRPRDTAATGHQGQAPPAPGALPRPPPMPPAPGGSVAPSAQQRQPQQGQPVQRTQPHRDARRAPPSPDTQHQGAGSSTHSQPQIPRPQVPQQPGVTPQRPPHDPVDAGPSYPTQAGPSSFVTPSGAPGPSIGGPSQPQRTPADTPVKKDNKKKNPITSPIKDLFPGFGKKDKKGKGKRDKKGKDEDNKQ